MKMTMVNLGLKGLRTRKCLVHAGIRSGQDEKPPNFPQNEQWPS